MNRIKYWIKLIRQVIRYDPQNEFLKIVGKEFEIYKPKIIRYEIEGGNILHNNKWGIFKLIKKKKDQSHKYKQYIDPIDRSLNWITPIFNRGVLGYPSIMKRFKTEYLYISKLICYYDIEFSIDRSKKFNLSFDIWLSDNKNLDFEDVNYEIMIWEDWNIARPSGKLAGVYNIDGDYWEVFHGKIDKSKEGLKGWYLVTFRIVYKDVRSHKIGYRNLLEFLEFCDKTLLLDRIRTSYLNSVELGSEVYTANGSLKFYDYELDFDELTNEDL